MDRMRFKCDRRGKRGGGRDVSESAAQDERGQARAESAAHGRPLARRWRRLRRSRAARGRGGDLAVAGRRSDD